MSTLQIIMCIALVITGGSMVYCADRAVVQEYTIIYTGVDPFYLNYRKLMTFLLFIMFILMISLLSSSSG